MALVDPNGALRSGPWLQRRAGDFDAFGLETAAGRIAKSEFFDGGNVRYDCGTTSDDPFSDRRFRAIHGGWRRGLDPLVAEDLLTLAATPGMPVEWLYAVFDWTPEWRRRFNRIRGNPYYAEEGRRNAATIVQGDGFRMLRALRDVAGYSGAVPLWTQFELQRDPRSDCALARMLGVNRQKLRRWRVNAVFDPLTFKRLRPNRGTAIG